MRSKLTIVVFLKDRFNFTKRFCEFLESVSYSYDVYFADGSLEDEAENYFKAQEGKLSFHYTYKRFPTDQDLPAFYKKCAAALSEIKTPYVMLCDNDDFPVALGQSKAIDFLEKEQSFVGCNGRILGLHWQPGKGSSLMLPYYCNTMDLPCDLMQETSLERIASYFPNFSSVYYSVFRTESLQKTFQEIENLGFSDLGIYELFFSTYQLSQGKIKQIKESTYVRQKGYSQTAAAQKGWFDRLFYTDWLSDLKNGLRKTASLIAKTEGKEEEKIYKELYQLYVERHKKRFLPARFYFLENGSLLFNPLSLKTIFMYKIYKYIPFLCNFINQKFFSKIVGVKYLRKILFFSSRI